eukprot:TRINITY_DN67732_c6_g2_i1.p1 TRINITY_DN67732_c6_g2~~TRINITY_DN67732_c6_g2_i1.p1  ORF type:complete len:394 (-),score=25.40 TRINITY_DN67732_c6_g2_i1:211-1392(-)
MPQTNRRQKKRDGGDSNMVSAVVPFSRGSPAATIRRFSEEQLLYWKDQIPKKELCDMFPQLHPCPRYEKCKYGDKCIFREMKRETCLLCLRGDIHDKCTGHPPELHPCVRIWGEGQCRYEAECIYKHVPRIWCLFCMRKKPHTKCSGWKPRNIPFHIRRAEQREAELRAKQREAQYAHNANGTPTPPNYSVNRGPPQVYNSGRSNGRNSTVAPPPLKDCSALPVPQPAGPLELELRSIEQRQGLAGAQAAKPFKARSLVAETDPLAEAKQEINTIRGILNKITPLKLNDMFHSLVGSLKALQTWKDQNPKVKFSPAQAVADLVHKVVLEDQMDPTLYSQIITRISKTKTIGPLAKDFRCVCNCNPTGNPFLANCLLPEGPWKSFVVRRSPGVQ